MRNKVNRLEEIFMRLVEGRGGDERGAARGGGRRAAGAHAGRECAMSSVAAAPRRRSISAWCAGSASRPSSSASTAASSASGARPSCRSVVTAMLYFAIFGSLIGRRVGAMGGFDYKQYIAPGLIMMSVITNSYGNVVASFFGAKFGKHVEELLVSPLPNWVIVGGYAAGGVLRGVLVGVAVTVVSLVFTHLHVHHLLVVLAALLLTSLTFALGGFLNALFAKNFDQVNWIPAFVLTPLTYFGGVFYSVSLLPRVGAHAVLRESDPLHGQRLPLRLPRRLGRRRRHAPSR